MKVFLIVESRGFSFSPNPILELVWVYTKDELKMHLNQRELYFMVPSFCEEGYEKHSCSFDVH